MILSYKLVCAVALISSISVLASTNESRRLSPGKGIGQQLREEHAKGKKNPKFTIVGEVEGSDLEFEVSVVEPVPAVTTETSFSEYGGPRQMVGELGHTLLVADIDEEEGTLAIISVNKETDEVNGIVQKSNGKKMKLTQKKGKKTKAFDAPEFNPPAWECGVTDVAEGGDLFDRSLFQDDLHTHGSHHHHHVDSNLEEALNHVKEGLRGSSVKIGKRRKLQGGGGYNYQVDLYIEIDQTLVNDNDGIFDPNTIEYVNSIFTGANTIYETEIDTHLNVLHIDLNGNYDNESSTSNALTRMRSIWAGQGFNYFPGMDLHHALLSRSLGGGIAYLGVLCNTQYGYGLSASMSGNFRSMDNAVVWDMMVVMHEIGHNFDSGHTHSDYNPKIDTCGCRTDNTCTEACPSELPIAKSSTMMSYCHLCSGGYNNMMYTFGGKYNGSGSRSDETSYTNAQLNGSYNTNPRRVNVKMYNHVSSRSCTDVPLNPQTVSPSMSPTQMPTTEPTQTPTKEPTTGPTTRPTQSPIEPTTNPTSSPTGSPVVPPTKSPTDSPTSAPTQSPSASPTRSPVRPTADPTMSPTNSPTTPPTMNPVGATTDPSGSPTQSPTTPPTMNPTKSPTKSPTMSPIEPTTDPTSSPTLEPTGSPTVSPTEDPTVSPTENPTSSPTENPTGSPTTDPTKNPTSSPTASPTDSPTAPPTMAPTAPTVSPTTSPTASPMTQSHCFELNDPQECDETPNCEWQKKRGGQCVSTAPGCLPKGAACPADPLECCTQWCVTRGFKTKCA